MPEDEVAHARRDHVDQVSVGQVLARAWRPGAVLWAVHALRAGRKAHVPVLGPQAFANTGPLDLAGAPCPCTPPDTHQGALVSTICPTAAS
jgi:hypothetical protein